MKQRNVAVRRLERYWRREQAAGRGVGTGFGPDKPRWEDLRDLRQSAARLKLTDPATWDDLDRHIVERYG